eukprot:GHUV01036131.1.p2 GENE.GHUV01036131.1~~GHUV01036131.1.p2  ORF type:complete len:105 (-),score=14.79 GHUV01036131.1:247-561(-)
MGAVDGTTMEGLMNELYHEDKGFNHQHCVFLSPRAPSMDQKHVLATHHAATKMHYLQGSPFRTEVGIMVISLVVVSSLCTACLPQDMLRCSVSRHMLPHNSTFL